jgi:hypothetical protein
VGEERVRCDGDRLEVPVRGFRTDLAAAVRRVD